MRSLHGLVVAALRGRVALAAGLVVGAALHAGGHAVLAFAAGALARGLVGASPRSSTTVLVVAIAGLGAALAKLVGGALAAGAEARLAGAVACAVRLAVLDHVLAEERPQAERLAALTTHVNEVERGVASGVIAELRAAVALVPLGILLVALAPRLAVSAVAALVAFGALAFGLRRAFKRANARAALAAGALVEAADEAVRHAELWATYGAKDRIIAHVARLGDVIAREHARLRVRSAVLSSTSEVLGALALVLVLLVFSGVDGSTVLPFAIAFFMTYRPLRDLVDARLVRARAEASLALLPLAPAEPASLPARAWTPEPLVLEGVTTTHGGHAPLSLRLAHGSINVLVGPTGSGKTSLLRALLGLGTHGGTVRWGTRALEAGVGPRVRPFAWVPQDAPVVRDTLAVNVGLGGGTIDPSVLLADLGAELATGDAILGADRPLSGGERQWVAMARAVATGLPVLLLDEPTSALDPEAQARLLEAIARLRGKRTVLLVTHRPEPMAIADRVITLDVAGSRAA